MPEDFDNDDLDGSDEPEGMRGLRKAKQAAEAEQKRLSDELAQADADRRELAAMKAGLNPADKPAAFFLKHYDGALTAEAMKAAAVEAGIMDDGSQAVSDAAAGQSQMASAFAGGETVPVGSTQIGPPQSRHEVPAEEAEMWQQFEARVKAGDMQGGAEVLRMHGRSMTGIEDYEFVDGAGAPNTTPIAGRPI